MRQYVQLLRVHPWAIPVIVTLLIGFEASQLVPYMMQDDPYPDYEWFVLDYTFGCDIMEIRESRNFLAWWLLCAGHQLTGYPAFFVIPFNMSVMPLTYLVATAITKDRVIGLIALTTLINLPLYTDWSTSSTYNMVWASFLLGSIYLMYSNRMGSSVMLVAAVLAKSMTLLYLPVWLYYSRKRAAIITHIIVAASLLFVLFVFGRLDIVGGTPIGFYPEHLDQAVFRNISLLWQVIPFILLLGGLYTAFRGDNPKGTKDVTVWLLWMIATTPVIHLFSEQLTFTYRFVVFGSFLSIFTGMVITRMGNWFVKAKMPAINH